MEQPLNIAFIGFGEAAEAFWTGLNRDAVGEVFAFDIKTDSDEAAVRDAMRERYQRLAVTGCDTLAEALAEADVVFSVVTADQAHAVATAAAPLLKDGALLLDCNSCAPQTKQASAKAVASGAGHYVDVAVMSPVNPKKNRTPLLLSGEFSEPAKAVLDRLDMNATVEPGPVGRASSIKMVRSIMVKGMEALFAECLIAGRLAGVDEAVLASLEASHPGFDGARRGGYNLERMTAHGIRRAAEMDEVCQFLNHLGIEEPLSARTVTWQRRLGELGVRVDENDYQKSTDQLINTLQLTPMKEA
ncbi:MAG: NAD(P)-dependent oxidoreductase [Saccharospirillum sp.]